MYESMLSSVPLYSVWPHFRRMRTSLPTLLSLEVSHVFWKWCIVCRTGNVIVHGAYRGNWTGTSRTEPAGTGGG